MKEAVVVKGHMRGQFVISDLFEMLIAFFAYLVVFAPIISPMVDTFCLTANTTDCTVATFFVPAVGIALIFTAIRKAVPQREGIYAPPGG